MYLSSSHPTHMDHNGPSLRYRCVFTTRTHEGQCATLPSGECLHHPATLPTWTIMDLVWDINLSSQSNPIRTSVQLLLVENVSSSHPTHMSHYWPSMRNQCVFSIPPPRDKCAALVGGEYLYYPATLPTWTNLDLVWEINVSSKSYPMKTSVQLWLIENVSII